MKIKTIATVLALTCASSLAHAQSNDANGFSGLNTRIDDISTDVAKQLARSQDPSRFGNPDFRPGWSGNASVGYSGQTGNNEAQDFTAAGRLRYAAGQFVQTIGFAMDYADAAGVRSKEDVFAVYDANYYINDKFYGFVLGRIQTDGLANTALDVKTDAFLGFGPGYRIINTEKVTWRVQAGIGQSYLKDGVGDTNSEIGYIASSRVFYGINENVFVSNDTDILKTNSALRINNDLGVNFKMSDAFSTRISYLTDYNDSRATRADNRLGVSLVFGF